MGYKIETLTRDMVRWKIEELRAIDRDVQLWDWDDSQYMLTLPGKWHFSKVALDDAGKIIGYIIISSGKNIYLHIHRYVVAPERRGEGIAKAMIRAACKQATGSKIKHLRCYVYDFREESKRLLMEKFKMQVVSEVEDHNGKKLELYGKIKNVLKKEGD